MKKIVFTIFLYISCLTLLTGVTYAWLVSQYKASTVAKIHPPTLISIQGPNEASLQSIDLSYDKSDVDKDGNITIRRPIVIKSEEEYFDFCIAHTTNINDLRIELFEAVDDEDKMNSYLAGINSNGEAFFWNKADGSVNIFTVDKYINKDNDKDKLIADGSKHTQTFSNYSIEYVQDNAQPLYWVSKGLKADWENTAYYKKYILEISWNESYKETDLLYIIARTSDTTGG